MPVLGSVIFDIAANTAKLEKGVRKSNQMMGRMEHRAKRTAAAMKKAFIGAFVAIGGYRVFEGLIKQTMEFETALVDMGKVTDRSLTDLQADISGVSTALGSSTELMQGYYQIISAGVTDTAKGIEMLTVASKAGKAAHTDTSEVIKGLTKMMAGFEGQIKDVTSASDLLFAIEKEGQTTFAEMIPVIGGLAKMSYDLGISSEEMGAALATITQTAGTTAEAATQYRSILVALSKSTEVARVVQDEWGYSGIQAAIAEKGLVDVLKDLKEGVGGTAEAMSKLLGRQEAMLGVSSVGAKNFTVFADKVKVMGERAGMTEKAFKEWQETLQGIWTTFKNTITNMAIDIGSWITPTVKRLVDAFKELWAILSAFPKGIFANLARLEKNMAGVNKEAKKLRGNLATFQYLLGDTVDTLVYWATSAGEAVAFVVKSFVAMVRTIARVGGVLSKTSIYELLFKKGEKERINAMLDWVAEKTKEEFKIIGKNIVEGVGDAYDKMVKSMVARRTPIVIPGIRWLETPEPTKPVVIKADVKIDQGAIDKAVAALQKKLQALEQLQFDVKIGGMEEYEASLARIERKYQKLRDAHAWTATELQELADLMQIEIDRLEEIADTMGTVWDGLQEGLKQYLDEMRTAYENAVEFAKGAAQAMQDSFEDLFFDAMRGKLESFKDYWNSFMDAISRMAAKMLAEWLMTEAIMKGASALTSLFGATAGTATTEGATTIAPDFATAHRGGLVMHEGGEVVKRYHAGRGRLASDEVPAILQKGEVVIPKDKVKSIRQAPTTINYNNIYTLDTESFLTFAMKNKRVFATAVSAAVDENHPLRRKR